MIFCSGRPPLAGLARSMMQRELGSRFSAGFTKGEASGSVVGSRAHARALSEGT